MKRYRSIKLDSDIQEILLEELEGTEATFLVKPLNIQEIIMRMVIFMEMLVLM